jgi:hypothetical protein
MGSIMPAHYPEGLRNRLLPQVVRRLVLAVVNLTTFIVPPAVLGGIAPSFTSPTTVTFPQGVRNAFTITTTGIPVPKITSSGMLPGSVKFVDNGDG